MVPPETSVLSPSSTSPSWSQIPGTRLRSAQHELCGLEQVPSFFEFTHMNSGSGRSRPALRFPRENPVKGGTGPLETLTSFCPRLNRHSLSRLLAVGTRQGWPRPWCFIPLIVNEQAKCSTDSEGPSGICWICAGKHFLPQGNSRVQWLWKRPRQFRKAALPLLVGLYTSCLASRGFPLFICKWGTVLRLGPQKQTLRQKSESKSFVWGEIQKPQEGAER